MKLPLLPVDKRVLVRPLTVAERKGSIFLPQEYRGREQMAQIEGVLVATGANAFAEAKAEAEARGMRPDAPKVGDTVFIAKYSGIVIKEGDEEYRLCNDEDVCGIRVRQENE